MASNLVSVQYIGHHRAVDVDFDGLGEQTVVFEEVVKVPENVAASLIEQKANWRLAPNSKTHSKPEEATK